MAVMIAFSELVRHGRWDAPFHLFNHEFGARARELSVHARPDQAAGLLAGDKLPTQALNVLAPMVRGSRESPGREQLLRAAREYPFLSVAALQDKGCSILAERRKELLAEAEAISELATALSAFGSPGEA